MNSIKASPELTILSPVEAERHLGDVGAPDPSTYLLQSEISIAQQETSPKNETYGRSLSTIRRLGGLMVRSSLEEARVSPEAVQAKVEFTTSVEEGFGTDMELGGGLQVRDFDKAPIVDGRVMAKDKKTAVSKMTSDGLECAEEALNADPRFRPQYIRSMHDDENALDVDAMARGERTYNTKLVFSPFPEEAAAITGDEYWRQIGYVPHLRRGFLQLYHAGEEGELITGSLSFDGSNKQEIAQLLGEMGVEVPEGAVTDEFLQYAITDNMTEAQAKALATQLADRLDHSDATGTTNTVDVTERYGEIIDKVFDESYIHIAESLVAERPTTDMDEVIKGFHSNKSSFNAHYQESLEAMLIQGRFTKEDAIVMHELTVFSTIEAMRAFHLKEKQSSSNDTGVLSLSGVQVVDGMLFNFHAVEQMNIHAMLGGFGGAGAKAGRVYSACGLQIKAGNDADGSPGSINGVQEVFGGALTEKKDDAENYLEDCEFVSEECPHCNAKNVKTVCKDGVFYGACGCNSIDGKAIARDGKSVEVEEHENQVSLEKLFEAVLKQGGPKNDPISAANN